MQQKSEQHMWHYVIQIILIRCHVQSWKCCSGPTSLQESIPELHSNSSQPRFYIDDKLSQQKQLINKSIKIIAINEQLEQILTFFLKSTLGNDLLLLTYIIVSAANKFTNENLIKSPLHKQDISTTTRAVLSRKTLHSLHYNINTSSVIKPAPLFNTSRGDTVITNQYIIILCSDLSKIHLVWATSYSPKGNLSVFTDTAVNRNSCSRISSRPVVTTELTGGFQVLQE